MKINLFHGSDHILKEPLFGQGKVYNDYGQGFYCTNELDMAKEWGVSKDKNGFANKYELEIDNLTILNLNDETFSILNWLTILLQNREFDISTPLANEAKQYLLENFNVDYQNKDAIIGYRADDSYFSFAQDFLNGGISIRQLNSAMKLGKLGQQFVLKSKKAFDLIKFTGYEIAESDEWFRKKENRDRKARQDYFDVKKNKRQNDDIFIIHILEQEIKNDDKRLR